MGSLDLPYELPDRPEQAGDRRADRLGAKPDPDERGRVYEAMRAHVETEDSGLAQETGLPLDGGERGGYWAEVPRLVEMWAGHEERWPADGRPQAAAERSADPAADAIGQLREGEPGDFGRRADGRTGEFLRGATGRLRVPPQGRRSSQGEDRPKGWRPTGPDARPGEIVQQIPDAIRYTFILKPENYAGGYYDIKARLENSGYEMYQSKNTWGNTEYKGINTRWMTPRDSASKYSSTPPIASMPSKYLTHGAYERISSHLTTDAERGELEAFQRGVSAKATRSRTPRSNIPDLQERRALGARQDHILRGDRR